MSSHDSREGKTLKTALTALVSAIIGGLVTALFRFVGVHSWEDKSGGVTVKEIALPHESSGATAGTPAATEDSSSVREDG